MSNTKFKASTEYWEYSELIVHEQMAVMFVDWPSASRIQQEEGTHTTQQAVEILLTMLVPPGEGLGSDPGPTAETTSHS